MEKIKPTAITMMFHADDADEATQNVFIEQLSALMFEYRIVSLQASLNLFPLLDESLEDLR